MVREDIGRGMKLFTGSNTARSPATLSISRVEVKGGLGPKPINLRLGDGFPKTLFTYHGTNKMFLSYTFGIFGRRYDLSRFGLLRVEVQPEVRSLAGTNQPEAARLVTDLDSSLRKIDRGTSQNELVNG